MGQGVNMKEIKKHTIPINGMSVQTFVHGYKGPSKLNVNSIDGQRISAYTGRLIRSLASQSVKK